MAAEGNNAGTRAADTAGYRWLPAVALLVACLFMLLHPYEGLIHDARLYMLQALNHLRPELYGNDVFLRYGSQDGYTFFTPAYAALISLVGPEAAASLLALVSVLALLVSAWMLARVFMPTRLAWLALGLFVVVPGFYGEGIVFSLIEGFMTPRMLAEALALFALAGWLRGGRVLPAMLLLVAMLIHPIMTFPAVALLFVMGWGLPHWRRLWPVALATALATGAALAGWIPLARWQFDAAWLPVAEWAPHLMLAEWTPADWSRIATVLVTLGFALRYLPDPGRRLAMAMLVTSALLLLLSWVGGDLLRIALIVQGQAWRCLWLATAVAVLLLPLIAMHCWSGTSMQRCGLVLLATAWLFGHQVLALYFALPAALAMAVDRRGVPGWAARGAERAAWILLAVVAISMLALSWTEAGSRTAATQDGTAAWMHALRAISDDRLLPALALLAGWHAASRLRSRAATTALVLAVALPASLIGMQAARAWIRQHYPREALAAFEAWRSIIPPGSDVLWSTRLISGSDPSTLWLLLERPSYYSSVQFNSGLFSREAALELDRRRKSIPLSLPTEQPMRVVFRGAAGEAPPCARVPVRYIIADVRIPDATVVPAPASAGPPFDRLTLQVCP